MAYIAAGSCEPLRVFARLEPRLREPEFDDALAARVHDPMFLLARQWQFGEFAGEDGGSAVFATLARRITPVTPSVDEPGVEAVPYSFPLLHRVRLGRALATRVDAAFTEHPSYDPAVARQLLAQSFGPLDTEPTETVAAARERSNARVARVRRAIAGCIDGVRAFALFTPGMAATDLPSAFLAAVDPTHLPTYLLAFEAHRAWFAATFAVPAATAWHGEQLEYAFGASVARDAGTIGLAASEYTGGRIDWYAADQSIAGPQPGNSRLDLRTVIPQPAAYPGMPKPRWWQFEDAAIDLGRLRADTTDSARIVVGEFALLYGNNWFVVATRQPAGTVAELEGVVVSDVFGWRTLVSATPSATDWTGWELFSLAPRGSAATLAALSQHLYLPGALGHVVDGDPLEQVVFVRDEGADMVWAVEQRIPDELGASRDGATAARRLRSELAPETSSPSPPPGAPLRYVAQTDVAEDWIPFIPIHKPNGTRAIRLQRAAILRTVPPVGSPIRPRTSILRDGISADDSYAEAYFVNEEEVPRAGVVVTGRWRRARRFDGTPVVWHGRAVTTGRGGGRSGLVFDKIEPGT